MWYHMSKGGERNMTFFFILGMAGSCQYVVKRKQNIGEDHSPKLIF